MQQIKNTLFKMENNINLKYILPWALLLTFVLQSCSVSKQINKQAEILLLKDSVVSTGHTGISIYEPATNKYWYNYNAEKYFVPASNTKLFSLYAGMKYLGDSLVGARYSVDGDKLFLRPSGDPTFLHPDFDNQPVLSLIQTKGNEVFLWLTKSVAAYGRGWSWDDFDQDYAAERSEFPVYGNLLWVSTKPLRPKNMQTDTLVDTVIYNKNQWIYIKPKNFANKVFYDMTSSYERERNVNQFYADSICEIKTIPFITNDGHTQLEILRSFTSKKISVGKSFLKDYTVIHSQPSDSLLKPMMYNSDNFFAEQTLLMASNEHLDFMNDEAIIDTLLNLDLKDIPQRPSWADGSGLSRYNLFTPQSFVYIINKMKNEFGLERLKRILPTGGTGTFKNYYVTDSAFIYAKTGSLTGVIGLSGILITEKNKLLIFSVLTNNFKGRASLVRHAVEKFIQQIRRKY